MTAARQTDYLKLHFIILLWGFTAVLGTLIHLPSLEIVFIRSGAAAVLMGMQQAWTSRPHSRSPGLDATPRARSSDRSRRDAVAFVGNGSLIGLHWGLFFASAKLANVSVCMVGMATVSLWTAVLEPLLNRDSKLNRKDLTLGVVVILAVLIIVRGDAFQRNSHLVHGLALAILAAIVAAVFSIINGKFTGRASPRVIVAYEMAGACLFCGAMMLVDMIFQNTASPTENSASYGWPSLVDWCWMLVLVSVCTIYAYTQYVELLKRLSVFTINFANNMEPIYGILLGALLFSDHAQVDAGFYVGALIIAFSVLIQPWIDKPRTAPRTS